MCEKCKACVGKKRQGTLEMTLFGNLDKVVFM